jgi:hypothetical protein
MKKVHKIISNELVSTMLRTICMNVAQLIRYEAHASHVPERLVIIP